MSGLIGAANPYELLLERGWSALPASYRMPDTAPSLEEARAWCRNLAETHYENFHVASWFLPQRLRPHFHAVYAYCRVSDDLGDEVETTSRRWRFSISGVPNWTPAIRAGPGIRFLSRLRRRFAPARFPRSLSRTCSSPFVRTRPSNATGRWTNFEATAATRPTR